MELAAAGMELFAASFVGEGLLEEVAVVGIARFDEARDGFEIFAGLFFGPKGGAFVEGLQAEGVRGSGVAHDAARVGGAFLNKDGFDLGLEGIVVERLGGGGDGRHAGQHKYRQRGQIFAGHTAAYDIKQRRICHNRDVALVLGSAHLSDEEFLEAFHSCRLLNSEFRHADHLRLAWLHLHRDPIEIALAKVREGIQNFAAYHGAAHLYHETITTAWVRLLATHHEGSFAEFLRENEERLNKELLHRFWSPEVLVGEDARAQWVAPDRRELPLP